MDKKDVFSKLYQATERLGDQDTRVLLDSLLSQFDDKEFIIPIIGQFSAGKSKMINRLIEKEVLPVKIIETTAAPTYVAYSEKEYAVIEFANDRKLEIDISEVKQWWNKALEAKDPVRAIHVFLPAPILSGGITFVDTPGVNTLIKNHVKMTEEILESAAYIIYVLNGPVTGYDKDMLDRIKDVGITTVFARTHADNLRSHEKSITVSMDEERSLLGDPEDIFFMCNDERQEKDYERWRGNFEQFRSFLDDLSERLGDIQELAVTARLIPVREQLIKKLDNRIKEMDRAKMLSNEELQARQKSLQDAIAVLEERLKDEGEKLEKKKASVEASCQKTLTHVSTDAMDRFKNRIYQISDEQYSEKVTELFRISLGAYMDNVNKEVQEVVDKWEKENLTDTREALKKVDLSGLHIQTDFLDGFDMDEVRIYEEKEAALIAEFEEKLYAINELMQKKEEELQYMGIDGDGLASQYEELKSELENQQLDLEQLRESYTPRYYIKESRWAKRLKVVGDVADLAMLLIPGPTWGKAGAKCAAKGADLANKSSKAAKAAGKMVERAGKAAKKIEKVDIFLDAAKLAKGASQTISKKKGDKEAMRASLAVDKANELLAQRGKGNILDYLSLSYWFEKAGEVIDPTHKELDQEYQAQFEADEGSYNEMIRRVRLQMQKIRAEMNAKSIDQKKAQEKLHSLENEEKSLTARFKQSQDAVRAEKERRMKDLFLRNAVTTFNNRLNEFRMLTEERVAETMANNLQVQRDAAIEYINGELADKRASVEEMISLKESEEKDHDTLAAELQDLISSLENILN